MIINYLTEEINIPKLNKEYNNNYSDLTEDEFMTMVKMDPSSYPRMGQDFNLNVDPVMVGNLASGGRGGLLIRCYRKGEKDFLNNFQVVQDACLKYLKNRGSFSIKDAGQFPSVKEFVDYVNSNGEIGITGTSEQPTSKKELTPEEKLDGLRQKQYPKIKTVDELIEVADLDVDSDTDHGQIGQIARNLLLPHYNAGERDFLKKKVSLKKAIQRFYNASDFQVKANPLSKYNEKEGNGFKYTIIDFLVDWAIPEIPKSNIVKNLQQFAKEDSEYELWGQCRNYDVIRYTSAAVGRMLDYCDLTAEEAQNKFPQATNPIDAWGRQYDAHDGKDSYKTTNVWCTGWDYSHVSSYNDDDQVLVAFIERHRLPYSKDRNKNWQACIYTNGDFHDIEQGENAHQLGWEGHIDAFIAMLKENPDVFSLIMTKPGFSKNNRLKNAFSSLNIMPTKSMDINLQDKWIWTDSVEEDLKPFIYSNPSDLTRYVEETGDVFYSRIDSLIIAEGVTAIPNFQFEKWRNLTKIKFPNTLKTIGHKAFSGCSSLIKLVLPPNLEIIGLGAFEGCSSLRGSIRLPLSIKQIQWNAFAKHNSRGISFVISPKRITDKETYPEPLLLAEEDKDFWFTPGRIKFSDN